MKVILFQINWLNPKQLVIGLFSWSKICHAGLLFKDEKRLFDASESRGTVDWNKELSSWGKQKIIVYDIPDNEKEMKQYALGKLGTKYDWKGIMGWFPFLASNDPQTVYCFELVLQTLLNQKEINGYKISEIASDLLGKLFRKPIDSDDIFILMERARLNPIYVGSAKDYNL